MAKGKTQRKQSKTESPKIRLSHTQSMDFFLLRPQGNILKVLNIRNKNV